MPLVTLQQKPMFQSVQRTVEIPQVSLIDRILDIPVMMPVPCPFPAVQDSCAHSNVRNDSGSVQDASKWLNKNHWTESDEFEVEQKESKGAVSPMMMHEKLRCWRCDMS